MITVKKDKIWKNFIREIGKSGDMTLKYHKGEMLFFLFLINLKVKDDRIKSLQEFYIKYILLSFKGLLLFEKIGEWFAQERSIPTKPRFRSVPDVTVLNSQLFTELLIKCRRLPRGFFWNRNPPPCASLSHRQVYKAVCQTTICFKKQNFLFYWFYRRKSFYNFSQVFIRSLLEQG